MSDGKNCSRCIFLRKYSADNGSWMMVCEAEDPHEVETGEFDVCVIEPENFDASYCLLFRAR
jgi:hypothetical protein